MMIRQFNLYFSWILWLWLPLPLAAAPTSHVTTSSAPHLNQHLNQDITLQTQIAKLKQEINDNIDQLNATNIEISQVKLHQMVMVLAAK